ELNRKWKQEAQQRITASDYLAIGRLDGDSIDLPRKAIREIIIRRRKNATIQQARARGIELTECDDCGQLFSGKTRHVCFKTGWRTQVNSKTGLPKVKDVQISQSGRGECKISHKLVVDTDRLEKEF